MTSLRQQLRNNLVALISLAVALGGLSYNTWRNERTEQNRNVRTAAFEILTRLADLERVVFLAQYDRDTRGGNPRIGWTYVLTIRDLSVVVPGPVSGGAAELQKVWGTGKASARTTRRRSTALTTLSGTYAKAPSRRCTGSAEGAAIWYEKARETAKHAGPESPDYTDGGVVC
jgi:hypothetical protein